jgi:hypothetical protein
MFAQGLSHSSVYPQIEDYSMVSFIPLNIRDEDSINYVLSNIDNAIQYGEDIEPKVKKKKNGMVFIYRHGEVF